MYATEENVTDLKEILDDDRRMTYRQNQKPYAYRVMLIITKKILMLGYLRYLIRKL